MDKKIRAAAENDSQRYDDNSWDNMNVLLNKHLPVRKDRRRYLLLLIVLLVAIPGFIITKNYLSSGTHRPVTEQHNTSAPDKSKNGISEKVQPGNSNGSTINSSAGEPTGSAPDAATEKEQGIQPKKGTGDAGNPGLQTAAPAINANQSGYKGKPLTEESFVNIGTKNAGKGKRTKPANGIQPSATEQPAINHEGAVAKQSTRDADQQKTTTPASQLPVNDQPKTSENAVADKPASKETTPAQTITDKPADPSATANNTPEKKKTPKKSTSRFSINLSAGPEVTSVGTERMGKWRAAYGIGFGYAINDRIGIRAGFYAGDKIYSADSTNYKTPYTSGGYNNKLSRIDADCFVYEIPVTLIYSFPASGKHNWFASTGLSTYLMKKEKYIYTYTGPWGQTVSYTHNYNNENSHYFSVLNLSGGYQYHFNDRLSLLAEPYVKVPLTGIGAGKVKLNAGGVLFTLSVKPFGK